MREYYKEYKKHFPEKYWEIYKANSAMIERHVRGNYLDYVRTAKNVRETLEKAACCMCGSRMIYGGFKGKDGMLWYCEDHQESVYNVLKELEDYEQEEGKERRED